MDSVPAERQVEEIESLCMNCHADGTTRLLLTRIPFFREIVLMSFECPECGFRNSEIQNAGEIQQKGVRVTFKVESVKDLQRQVVKSDSCIFRIEDIDLEIPAGRGQLSNVEGLISMVKQDLEVKQPERKELDESLFSQVQVVIEKLADHLSGDTCPFTITADDPTGNSSIEPSPDDKSGKYVRKEYPRSASQNEALGLAADEEPGNGEAPAAEIRPEYHATDMGLPTKDIKLEQDDTDIAENEVYSFPASCPGCMKACTTHMKMVQIPHFEQVVLMSTVCEHCGYRSNEVKSGGAVPALGRRLTVHVQQPIDLSRDILKSESCALSCPELSLNVEPGTLGGRFTTIEGLLTQIRDDLRQSIFDTGDEDMPSDSMDVSERNKWTRFFKDLDSAINGETQFHIVLDDPLAASYVQSLTSPNPDPQIETQEYKRTEEEEEHLGLHDIKTEGYEVDAEKKKDSRDGGVDAGVEAIVKAVDQMKQLK